MIDQQQMAQPSPMPQPQQEAGVITPSKKPMGLDYQMFVAKGLQLISSPETRNSMLTLLKGGDPVNALARALVVILQKMDSAARAKGTEISDLVKMYGAHDLIVELERVAEAANIFNLDKDHVELAFSAAVQNYIKGEIQAGRINPNKLMMQTKAGLNKMKPEERQKVMQSMQRLQQTAQRYNGGKK